MPSPEDVVLSKLLWYKRAQSDRHLNDARGVWEIQQDTLEQSYLDRWATRLGLEVELEQVKQGLRRE